MSDMRHDEIGYWPEIKLDIVREYAQAYSAILSKDLWIRKYLYKGSNDAVAAAFQEHLKKAADFAYVPDIFNRYRDRGAG